MQERFFKRNFARSFIVVAFFLLLVCLMTSAFLVASASDDTSVTEKPTIGAYSIALHDSVHINYAVKVPEGVDRAGLLVWEREAPKGFVHDDLAVDITEDSGYADIDGIRYQVFVYEGIAAKEYADDVYAVPYVVDNGQYVYGEPSKYGVLYYAAAMSNDIALSKLLDGMLEYGALAQEYFEYNISRPANSEFSKVAFEGGMLTDGVNYGIYQVGDPLPIPKAPEGTKGVFDGWYLDSDFSEKLNTVPTYEAKLYAKWVDPIVNADFSKGQAATTVTCYTGGIRFNAEGTATTEMLSDECGEYYLRYINGEGTTIYASNTDIGTSLSAKLTTDVFSYSISFKSVADTSPLTTSAFGIRSNKKTSGSSTYYAMLDFAHINADSTVTTYSGATLGDLSDGSLITVNVAVNFADSTFTYYSENGDVLATEIFTAPKNTGATTAKAWQKLVAKYLFYAEFNGGEALDIYSLTVAEGNIFG